MEKIIIIYFIKTHENQLTLRILFYRVVTAVELVSYGLIRHSQFLSFLSMRCTLKKKNCSTNQFHACDTIRLTYSIGLFGTVIVVVCYCSWPLLRAAISFEMRAEIIWAKVSILTNSTRPYTIHIVHIKCLITI